jgi:hypothetical protein
MKKLAYAMAFLAFAGCSSYSEIARWNSDTLTNDGERPVASFITQNFSYQLFGVIPLCSGQPWTEGEDDIKDNFDVRLFSDDATIDNNLVSLRHALERVGSNRISHLHTTVDNDFFWSLFILNRHEVRTRCLILP